MANPMDWEQYAVQDNSNEWDQYASDEPAAPEPEEELGAMEKFYRASGIHGANKAFANVFGFGPHVQNANAAAERARQTHPNATGAGEFVADVYSSVPFYMAGGLAGKALPGVKNLGNAGKFGKYLQNIIGTGIGGAGLGAVRSVNEDETRGGNIGKDALISSLVEAIIPGIKYGFKPVQGMYNQAAKQIFGAEGKVAKDMLRGLTPAEGREAGSVYEAGKRLGVELTPAEASGSPILAQAEGKLGTSEPGQEAYMQFKKKQKLAQEQSVKDLLQQVSPSKKVAAGDVRKAAQSQIDKDTQAMIKKARPHYEAAEKQTLTPNKLNSLLKDANIEGAWSKVLKDPLYKAELEGFGANSVKALDLTKRELDDQIAKAVRGGEKNAARILRDAKDKLVTSLDKVSPEYKEARRIYAEDAKPLQDLLQGNVGKIADISDRNLKTVSKVIFDPSQTDIEVLGNLRDKIGKQDPEAWNRIIRNEMERRLDSKLASKTRNSGSNFYDQIVGTDRNYEQFHEALKGNKVAQQKLTDMRASFKNLINSYTVKTSAAQAKSSLDVPRSGPQFWQKLATNLTGGQYDKAAVEIITNPKWADVHLPKITANSSNKQKAEFLKALADVSKKLGSASTRTAAVNAGKNDERKD